MEGQAGVFSVIVELREGSFSSSNAQLVWAWTARENWQNSADGYLQRQLYQTKIDVMLLTQHGEAANN